MREFLKGLELDKETIDSIMAEHGKAIQGLKEDKEELNKKVSNFESEIKTLKENSSSNEDWKTKYEELNKTIEDEKAAKQAEKEKNIKEERVNAFFNDVKFSSNSAKAGVIADFNKMDFKYDEQNKKFIGGTEWLEDYKKNDSGAFMSDVANPKFTTTPTAPKTGTGPVSDAIDLNPRFKKY